METNDREYDMLYYTPEEAEDVFANDFFRDCIMSYFAVRSAYCYFDDETLKKILYAQLDNSNKYYGIKIGAFAAIALLGRGFEVDKKYIEADSNIMYYYEGGPDNIFGVNEEEPPEKFAKMRENLLRQKSKK